MANMKPITLNPNMNTMLIFSHSKSFPRDSELSFVIEGTDEFSIICRAVRDEDSIKVFIPRLLNLFRGGTYRSKFEVILEDRRYVPLTLDVTIQGESAPVVEKKEMNISLIGLMESFPINDN